MSCRFCIFSFLFYVWLVSIWLILCLFVSFHAACNYSCMSVSHMQLQLHVYATACNYPLVIHNCSYTPIDSAQLHVHRSHTTAVARAQLRLHVHQSHTSSIISSLTLCKWMSIDHTQLCLYMQLHVHRPRVTTAITCPSTVRDYFYVFLAPTRKSINNIFR